MQFIYPEPLARDGSLQIWPRPEAESGRWAVPAWAAGARPATFMRHPRPSTELTNKSGPYALSVRATDKLDVSPTSLTIDWLA